MSYATQQNLIDRFGQQELIQLTDRTKSGAIDSAVVNRALEDADAEINGYLAAKYTLPLATVPATLTRIACDIARYYLYEDRATEQVAKRYDDAVKFLRSAANGLIQLGVDAANNAPAASGGPQVSAPDRVFTRGDAKTAGTLDDF